MNNRLLNNTYSPLVRLLKVTFGSAINAYNANVPGKNATVLVVRRTPAPIHIGGAGSTKGWRSGLCACSARRWVETVRGAGSTKLNFNTQLQARNFLGFGLIFCILFHQGKSMPPEARADSLNSSIVAQHNFETYEIAINDILIQMVLDTMAFDSTQRQTIETIAAMCPLEGGVAVYKARSLLYLYNDTIWFDDETLCTLPSARLAEKEQPTVPQQDGMKVYPNPNCGQFTVEFSSAAPRSISLYNILGQRVYSVRTNEQLLNLDISFTPISPGLLLLEAGNEVSNEVFKSKIIYEE